MAFLSEILLQLFGELILQLFFQVLVELGLRSIAEPFRRQPNPWMAAFGYALLGTAAGAISLLPFPALMIDSPFGRLVSFGLSPVAAGAAMAARGVRRRSRDQELIRIDRFFYGYLFALPMAPVRFHFGHSRDARVGHAKICRTIESPRKKMPFVGVGLHLLVALFFAVHVVRNGQPIFWLFVLFSFPLLGSIVYFVAIWLPNSRLQHGARKAVSVAARSLDPTRELREARATFDYTPTAQNQMRLAAALLEGGQAEEAARNYEACLKGPPARSPPRSGRAMPSRISRPSAASTPTSASSRFRCCSRSPSRLPVAALKRRRSSNSRSPASAASRASPSTRSGPPAPTTRRSPRSCAPMPTVRCSAGTVTRATSTGR